MTCTAPGADSPDFDNATNTWKLTFGYIAKPVLLDAVNLVRGAMGEESDLPPSSRDHTAVRELVLESLRVDLTYGYGRTAKRLIDESRNLEGRSIFRVNARYEVPLDTLWAHVRDAAR